MVLPSHSPATLQVLWALYSATWKSPATLPDFERQVRVEHAKCCRVSGGLLVLEGAGGWRGPVEVRKDLPSKQVKKEEVKLEVKKEPGVGVGVVERVGSMGRNEAVDRMTPVFGRSESPAIDSDAEPSRPSGQKGSSALLLVSSSKANRDSGFEDRERRGSRDYDRERRGSESTRRTRWYWYRRFESLEFGSGVLVVSC